MMRPPLRLLQPLEASSLQLSSKTFYVCSSCRHEVPPSCSVGGHQPRRNASSFTDRLRQRIWGTDKPPGLKDPYGGEGLIERAWKKRKAEYTGEEEIQQEEEELEEDKIPEPVKRTKSRPAFVPAKTAENLKTIGHLSTWKDYPPLDADKYYPFLSRKKIRTKEQVRSAAHSVAVELCILHDLKKPLTAACDIFEHDMSIWAIIRRCQIKEGVQTLDGALIYPSEEKKKLLHYVFEQLGPQPETENKKTPQSESEVEPESASDNAAVTSEDIEEEKPEVFEQPPEFYEPETQTRATKVSAEPKDKGYLSLPLTDPVVKFAFLKRLAQITGYPVPDTRANKATNVKHVTDYLEKAHWPPKKLAEELSALPSRRGIPNLTVKFKRYTKADHDRDVGRRKVIEEALRERGLLYEQDFKIRL